MSEEIWRRVWGKRKKHPHRTDPSLESVRALFKRIIEITKPDNQGRFIFSTDEVNQGSCDGPFKFGALAALQLFGVVKFEGRGGKSNLSKVYSITPEVLDQIKKILQ